MRGSDADRQRHCREIWVPHADVLVIPQDTVADWSLPEHVPTYRAEGAVVAREPGVEACPVEAVATRRACGRAITLKGIHAHAAKVDAIRAVRGHSIRGQGSGRSRRPWWANSTSIKTSTSRASAHTRLCMGTHSRLHARGQCTQMASVRHTLTHMARSTMQHICTCMRCDFPRSGVRNRLSKG